MAASADLTVNALGRYLEDSGRSTEEVAVDLTALLGKPISAAGVRLWAGKKKAPKAWADALSLPDEIEEEPHQFLDDDEPPATAGGEGPLRDDASPPTPLDGARVGRPGPPPGVSLAAKKRITFAYAAIGGGVAEITGNQGVGAVMDSYSPALADAWMKAAETNANVAKIVRFLDQGGPVGELVFMHLLLVGAILYVSGRGPDQLDAVYGKFAGHRATYNAKQTLRRAGLDGSGQEHSPDPMAGTPS